MNIQHLRHFVAVAEELNFGRAAERIGMAQAPLSQSIRRLEDSLGCRLFERTRRHVELSPAGDALLPHAREIIYQADYSRIAVTRAMTGLQELAIGYVPVALANYVPLAIQSAKAFGSNIKITLVEAPARADTAWVLSSKIDFGFIGMKIDEESRLQSRLIEMSPLVAAIPEHWPLARKRAIRMADFDKLPMLNFPPHQGLAVHQATIRAFQSAGAKINVVQEASSDSTRLKLASAGLGFAFIQRDSAPNGYPGVALREIVDLPDYLKTPLYMVWNRLLPTTAWEICQVVLDGVTKEGAPAPA